MSANAPVELAGNWQSQTTIHIADRSEGRESDVRTEVVTFQ